MIQLCAHLGYQFQEFAPAERFVQASKAGFKAVEWPTPYAFTAQQLRAMLQENGLQWVQMTTPGGDAGKGEKGLAALPGREKEFDEGLRLAIDYALALDSKWIHPMSGVVPSWEAPGVRTAYLRNLRHACGMAADNGLKVMVEVINDAEVPGFAMCSYERARDMFDELDGAPFLLLDAYHAHNLTGDAVALVRAWKGRIGHVQIADAPGRHEPGTGTIDFKALFAELGNVGYDGWVGCEYRPATTTLDGLKYLAPYLAT